MCFCGRRLGRHTFACVFVEDAEMTKKHSLYYNSSSLERLPQKHNGFSVFFRVFHKNTMVCSVFLNVFHKNTCVWPPPPSSFNHMLRLGCLCCLLQSTRTHHGRNLENLSKNQLSTIKCAAAHYQKGDRGHEASLRIAVPSQRWLFDESEEI